MARIFIDGFNSGDSSAWDAGSMSAYPADRSGFGPYCASKGNGAAYVDKFFSSKSAIYFKMRYESQIYGHDTYPVISFFSGAAMIAVLRQLPTSMLLCFATTSGAGSSGTVRATSINAVSPSKVYLLEFYFYPLTSDSGRFVLKIDGTTWIDWTGVTSAGAESVDQIRIGLFSPASQYPYFYFSDVVIDDADWIGNTRVGYKQISGAGNAAQWTPSIGDNYTCVDEQTPSDVDLVASNTNDQQDMHEVGSLQVGSAGYSVNSIKSVQVQAVFNKTGTPTPTSLALGVRTSDTDDFKGSHAPEVSMAGATEIWDENPVTETAWDTEDVFEIGYKAVA